MPMIIVKERITKSDLAEIAKERYGDLIKAVVDIDRKIMAIGGELHSDEEGLLLDDGSLQKDLWGINLNQINQVMNLLNMILSSTFAHHMETVPETY